MRIMYYGMDERLRISKATGVKFIEDGFRETDKNIERDASINGPVVVIHTKRSKGGKRIVMEVDPRFDMKRAEKQLLEQGWLDLSNDAKVRLENLF